jgi:hypothetical protein
MLLGRLDREGGLSPKAQVQRVHTVVGQTELVDRPRDERQLADVHEATEAVAARRALKREQTVLQMYGFMSEALGMIKNTHVIYVGQHKRPVTITGLLPQEFLDVATAVVKVDQALDRELRRTTGR